jgi:DNA-binding NarL/FixJ family response regulator
MNSQKKILLIDGDHPFCDTIKTALLPQPYEIINASTCISGIHKAIQHNPDLIFYNTNLEPLEGSEVFKALKQTSSFSHIPIVFYKDKDEAKIINFIINNGNSTHTRTQNHNKLQLLEDEVKEVQRDNNQPITYDFKILFHLSPNGMFIFDKNGILSVNPMLQKLITPGKPDESAYRMEDFFDKTSLQLIKKWIKDYSKNGKAVFNQQVIFKDKTGERIAMNLMIAELQKAEDSIHYLGTFQPVEGINPMVNYQLAQKVCALLTIENIEVSEELEMKILKTVKLGTKNEDQPQKMFFTRREDEVLRLSMEGLSIKIIADRLSLSMRTVEKYRTKLMLKSGAKNIVEVIVFAIKNNLLKI